jgi:hypothetical protein
VIDLLNYLASNPHLLIGAVVVGTLVVFGTVMCRQFKMVRANERYASYHCVKCGYDLRGSKERCPECAFPIQPPELPLTMELSERLMQAEWPKHSVHLRHPGADEQRVDVYSSGVNSAKSLADFFHAHGIPASIRFSRLAVPGKYRTQEFEFGTLCVWSGDLDHAIELIRHLSRTAPPLPENQHHRLRSGQGHAAHHTKT